VLRFEGDYEQAVVHLDESLAMWRDLGDHWGLATALFIRGGVARAQNQNDLALALFEESLSLLREVGDLWGIAHQLGELGALVQEQGDYERASELLHQCLAAWQEFGGSSNTARSLAHPGLAWSLANLGRVAYEQHQYEQASDLYRRSLRLFREAGNRWGPAVCFEFMAAAEVSNGRALRAARLFGAAAYLREAIREPLSPAEQAHVHRSVAAARTLLGEAEFTAAWAAGRGLSLERAIDYALEDRGPA